MSLYIYSQEVKVLAVFCGKRRFFLKIIFGWSGLRVDGHFR